MSQNTHHLLLFFADQASHETAVRAVLELRRGDLQRSAELQARLGVDLTRPWSESWFNHVFTADPQFIRFDFDTSTSAPLPLQLLAELFEGGLRAAVLEVFYDQVGETQRYHFLAGKQVNPDAFLRAEPQAATLAQQQLGESQEGCDVWVAKAVGLKKLLAEQESEARDRKEAIETFIEIAKVSRETGSNPVELVQGVLVLGGLAKGLLQALAFTLVTVLLFKGIWLWLALGLVLAVVLPLYHANQANKPFDSNPDNNDNDDQANDSAEQEHTPC